MNRLWNYLLCCSGKSNGTIVNEDKFVAKLDSFNPEDWNTAGTKPDPKVNNIYESENENIEFLSPKFMTVENDSNVHNTNSYQHCKILTLSDIQNSPHLNYKNTEFTFNEKNNQLNIRHSFNAKSNQNIELEEIDKRSFATKFEAIQKNESKNSFKIKISDFDGDLFWNKDVFIDRNGMINRRDAHSSSICHSMFAIKGIKSMTFLEERQPIIKDKESDDTFFLNCDSITINNTLAFVIIYKNEKSCYILRKQRINLLLYYQISHLYPFCIPFNKKSFILIGSIFISLQPFYFKEEKAISIEIYLDKNEETTNYTFCSTDSPITVGRDPKCKIKLPYKSISKLHCEIAFNNDNNFYICDGFGGTASTNGTWYIVEDDLEIIDKFPMIFKFSNKVFKIERS